MVSYRLTKSKYIRGLQCYKALYCDLFHKEMAFVDEATRVKFQEGRLFEKTFKATFPGGIDVSEQLGMRIQHYPKKTEELLSSEDSVTLFEAGFVYNEVLVLVDVLHKDSNGHITAYEVKNAQQPKEVFLQDVAIQHYVISHQLSNVVHFYLVYNDGNDGFVKLDLLESVQSMSSMIEEQVNAMKLMLQGTEPNVEIGPHCNKPYPCPYKNYCERKIGQTEIPF